MKKYVPKLCFALPVLIALFIVVWPMAAPITGNEMGYCVLNYYIIYPLCLLVCGVVLGSVHPGKKMWFFLPFAALLGVLMPLPVFHTTDLLLAGIGLVASGFGLLVGSVVGKVL